MNLQNSMSLFDVKQNFNATKLLLLYFSVFSFKYWIVIHRCRQLTLDSLSSFPLQTYCWVEFHCFEFLRMKDMLFLLLKYLLLFLGITIPIHLGCQLYIDIQVTNHTMHSYYWFDLLYYNWNSWYASWFKPISLVIHWRARFNIYWLHSHFLSVYLYPITQSVNNKNMPTHIAVISPDMALKILALGCYVGFWVVCAYFQILYW